MANFNTHLSTAFVLSTTASLTIYKAGMVTLSEFVLCAIIGTVGGLLPDIDIDNAVGTRIGFNIISILVAFGSVAFWISYLSVLELLFAWFIIYMMMRWGVFMLFHSFTTHRGIVHSIPYMLCLALILVNMSFYMMKNDAGISWFYGLFLFFGSILHLILDEVYSVNVFGLRIKQSFGTALKFYESTYKKRYITLYLLVIVLFITAPPIRIFWQNLTNPITLELFQKNLLPAFLHH